MFYRLIDWYPSSRGDAFLEILAELAKFKYSFFLSLPLTDKRRSNAPPDALPALRRTPHVGEVEQSMTGARQTVAVTITCRKSNKNSLERRAGAYRSRRKKSLYLEKTEAEPTPWNSILLWKLMVDEPFKKFPTFYGIRKFITLSSTWDPILGMINPFHTHTLLSSNIAFNITVIFVPTWSLIAGLPKKIYAFTWRDRGKCENLSAWEPVAWLKFVYGTLQKMNTQYQLPNRRVRQHRSVRGIGWNKNLASGYTEIIFAEFVFAKLFESFG